MELDLLYIIFIIQLSIFVKLIFIQVILVTIFKTLNFDIIKNPIFINYNARTSILKNFEKDLCLKHRSADFLLSKMGLIILQEIQASLLKLLQYVGDTYLKFQRPFQNYSGVGTAGASCHLFEPKVVSFPFLWDSTAF